MMKDLVKNCSLTRQLNVHSFSSSSTSTTSTASKSSSTTSSSSSPSFFSITSIFFLLLLFCTLPSCSVLAFKSGHVEPVPGNVLRNARPPLTPTGTSNSQRTSNPFPPTAGGSRSAILMKLTSPRREFGGHVYEDPNASHQQPHQQLGEPNGSLHSPISSDLYAFSKSTESQQIHGDANEHIHHHAPFVRFPTISSPFSGIKSSIQSRETYHHRQPPPPPPPPPQKKAAANIPIPTLKQRSPPSPTPNPHPNHHRHHHPPRQTPFAQSVSDLLAQHEEPSPLFGTARDELEDELLLDSYYTTGSEDEAAAGDAVLNSSQFDNNDRYTEGSQEGSGDLFEKQTATPTSNAVVDASSSSPPQTPTTNHSSNSSNSNKSTSSNDSNSKDNHDAEEDDDKSSSLSKPKLLPLPANYLSLATFRQIDNTLEKSSSNILSRIANFWRNRTMSSSNGSRGNNSTAANNNNATMVTVNSNNNGDSNSSSSNNRSSSTNSKKNSNSNGDSRTNMYTRLASDSSSSSVDAEKDNAEATTDHDTVFLQNLDNDNRSRVNHRRKKNNNNDNNNHHHHHHRNNATTKSSNDNHRQSESSASGVGGVGGSVQPTSKYISIEDLDTFGGGGTTANSNQYLSLDDEEEGVLGEEDFVTGSSSGGKTQEATMKTSTEQQHEQQQEDGNHLNDHFRRHHDHHSSSVEDYITSETTSSAQAAELDAWLVGGGDDDSAQSTHTFHDDLFHTTTGTITAVIDNSSSSGKIHHKKDLMSSGSSKIERVQKSDSDKKRVSSATSSNGSGGASSSSSSSSSTAKGNVKRAESDKIWSSIDSHFGRHDLIESAESEEEHDYYYGMTIGGFLKRELWTIPLFVLASLNMILIILFEVYVLCRARGTSRRHLFLGQMLLFGLFLCSFLALMFAVHPSIIGCFVGRLGVGITYSLIFSVLMVKCVFLLSLDTGVYLPTSYQGILLFFAVAVQVAIDSQWVIMYPPFLQTVESGRSILLQCGTSFVQLLYSLSYVGFLILVVGFLAGRAAYKGVVENYKEAVYILITAVVTVPVALSWTVAGWMLQGRHQDACVSFGLVAHSLTTFLIMFMPKGRQLASLDKEAVCFEDQEDQCSGYSPSFFHFKPTTKNYKTALWGDGNLYTTLEPTVSTINPNVFFHRNDFHSGMIY